MSGIAVSVKVSRTSTSLRASLTRSLIRTASSNNLVNGNTNTLPFSAFPSLSMSASNLPVMD